MSTPSAALEKLISGLTSPHPKQEATPHASRCGGSLGEREGGAQGGREAVVELAERGHHSAAVERVFAQLGEAIVRSVRERDRQLEELTANVDALRERTEKLAASIDALRERTEGLATSIDALRGKTEELAKAAGELHESVVELRKSLEEEKRKLRQRLEGRVGRLEGLLVERDVADRLAAWFERKAPEYEVIRWFRTGADVLIEGRGVFAAVEITVRPDLEDKEQLKVSMGALENAWGRWPNLLVVWSESGLVPEHVAREADRAGIRIARGPGELKALLDEVASEGGGR